MIVSYSNFLNKREVDYFLNLYSDEREEYIGEEGIYKFYHNDLIGRKLETLKFKNYNFTKFRIQKVNEKITQVPNTHKHGNPWSFVIFLNTDYLGGELIFNSTSFTPESGKMVYFSGDERHKVQNCIGDRYTLVGFMLNNPMRVNNTEGNAI